MSGLKTGTPEAYVGRAECGCVVAITVNMLDHKRDVAKTVAEWVRDGLSIEGMTIEAVRSSPFGCKCGDRPKEPPKDQMALEL